MTSTFLHINEGYDHVTKDKIFVNGELVHTTAEHKESEVHTETFKLPRGTQNVRIENWTLYEGTWELTSVENNYSVDGFYEAELELGKKNTIDVTHDLDNSGSSPEVIFKKIK